MHSSWTCVCLLFHGYCLWLQIVRVSFVCVSLFWLLAVCLTVQYAYSCQQGEIAHRLTDQFMGDDQLHTEIELQMKTLQALQAVADQNKPRKKGQPLNNDEMEIELKSKNKEPQQRISKPEPEKTKSNEADKKISSPRPTSRQHPSHAQKPEPTKTESNNEQFSIFDWLPWVSKQPDKQLEMESPSPVEEPSEQESVNDNKKSILDWLPWRSEKSDKKISSAQPTSRQPPSDAPKLKKTEPSDKGSSWGSLPWYHKQLRDTASSKKKPSVPAAEKKYSPSGKKPPAHGEKPTSLVKKLSPSDKKTQSTEQGVWHNKTELSGNTTSPMDWILLFRDEPAADPRKIEQDAQKARAGEKTASLLKAEKKHVHTYKETLPPGYEHAPSRQKPLPHPVKYLPSEETHPPPPSEIMNPIPNRKKQLASLAKIPPTSEKETLPSPPVPNHTNEKPDNITVVSLMDWLPSNYTGPEPNANKKESGSKRFSVMDQLPGHSEEFVLKEQISVPFAKKKPTTFFRKKLLPSEEEHTAPEKVPSERKAHFNDSQPMIIEKKSWWRKRIPHYDHTFEMFSQSPEKEPLADIKNSHHRLKEAVYHDRKKKTYP